MKNKLKLIYLPFLLIGVSFIGLYTFLNWLLFIKIDLLSFNEIVTHFLLPVFLICIINFIFLRPRIKLLNFKRENTDLHYQLVAIVLISISTVKAQQYMTIDSGKLTQLPSISSIDKQEKTKFYTVENYFVSKNDYGTHLSAEVTKGRYNRDLSWFLFIVFPIYESISDALTKDPLAWMGVRYYEKIDNKLSDEEKEKKFKKFLVKSEKNLDSMDVQQFVYLDRIGPSDDLDGYKEALQRSPKFNSKNNIILIPVNEPFEARHGNSFNLIFISYIMGALIWFLMLLAPKLNEERTLGFFKVNPIKRQAESDKFLDFFIPTKNYFVTPIILNMNVFVFLLMCFSGYGFMSIKFKGLYQWGANHGPSIANGEYWRLLASTFLHGGVIHLASNMFGLLIVGTVLEPLLGKAKFVFAYLLTGALASLASIYWTDAAFSIGASGAIFGLYGILFAFLMTTTLFEFDLVPEFKTSILSITVAFISYNLVNGFISQGIDNAAHIGGLLSGFLLGLLYAKLTPKDSSGFVGLT